MTDGTTAMARDFKLPDLGEGVHEGQVIRVHVAEGDVVAEDQPLLEVETDKAAVEIPSPVSGRVTKVHVREQQVVNVGDVMVSFDGGGDDASAPSGDMRDAEPASRGGDRHAAATPGLRPDRGRPGGRIKPASPAVRKLARTIGIDLNAVDGSGPGGRVTRADVEQAARATAAPGAAPPPREQSPRKQATPGRGERVARSESTTPSSAPPSAKPASPGEAGADAWGPIGTEPISRIRRTIADTMSRSWTTIPHVTDSFDADVTELDRLRKRHNERVPGDERLTLLPLVIFAVARTLPRHPLLNASWDEEHDRIVYHRYVSIAVGVHTDRGLVAPVLREADRCGVADLDHRLRELTEKARTATFAVDDLRGGTFTISNAGAMGGSRYSTPIINPPQAAVLAIGRSRKQPAVVDDAVVPRLIMPLSLSFDHRLIDGGTEIAFQADLVAAIENPLEMLL